MGLGGVSVLFLSLSILERNLFLESLIWIFGVTASACFLIGLNHAVGRKFSGFDKILFVASFIVSVLTMTVWTGDVARTHSSNFIYFCMLALILSALNASRRQHERAFRLMKMASLFCMVPLLIRSLLMIIWPETGVKISLIIWTGIHGGYMIFLTFILQMMYSVTLIEELKRVSLTDALTGLQNRRAFNDLYQVLRDPEGEREGDTGLLICDLDFFKKVNDNYGHEKGDEVLKAFAETLKANSRSDDFVSRIGGEEFVIIAKNSTEQSVQALADRLLEATRALTFSHNGEEFHISTSIGAGLVPARHGFKDPFKIIDKALYHAKETGRDKVTYVPLPAGV